jgi:putative flippase GtrA
MISKIITTALVMIWNYITKRKAVYLQTSESAKEQ